MDKLIFCLSSDACGKPSNPEAMPCAPSQTYFERYDEITDLEEFDQAIDELLKEAPFLRSIAGNRKAIRISKMATQSWLDKEAAKLAKLAYQLMDTLEFLFFRSSLRQQADNVLNGERYGIHLRYVPEGDLTITDFARYAISKESPRMFYIDKVYRYSLNSVDDYRAPTSN